MVVGGSVNKPGPVLFKPGMTIDQAVKAAQGSIFSRSLKNVTLYRDGKSRKCDLTVAADKNIPLLVADTIDVGNP